MAAPSVATAVAIPEVSTYALAPQRAMEHWGALWNGMGSRVQSGSMGQSEMTMQFGALLMRAKVQLGGLPMATPWLQAILQHVLGTPPAPWLTEVYRKLLGLQ